jgi:hypothetical protein
MIPRSADKEKRGEAAVFACRDLGSNPPARELDYRDHNYDCFLTHLCTALS